ncbi:hypothetical protein J6590_002646 [Homalodisca vitripennis]|nr:hypothetical protein J6590_002646 [Homalodisca vitripennis]
MLLYKADVETLNNTFALTREDFALNCTVGIKISPKMENRNIYQRELLGIRLAEQFASSQPLGFSKSHVSTYTGPRQCSPISMNNNEIHP